MEKLTYTKASTEDIQKALEELNISYDQNSTRSELWGMYKDAFTEATDADPKDDSTPDDVGELVSSEDTVLEDEVELNSDLSTDDTVGDSRADNLQPSPPASVESQPALDQILKDAADVLEELAAMPIIPRHLLFLRNRDYTKASEESLKMLVKVLSARRRHLRYSEERMGAPIYAAEIALAFFDSDTKKVNQLYEKMIACLEAKWEHAKPTVRGVSRFRRNNRWADIVLRNE